MEAKICREHCDLSAYAGLPDHALLDAKELARIFGVTLCRVYQSEALPERIVVRGDGGWNRGPAHRPRWRLGDMRKWASMPLVGNSNPGDVVELSTGKRLMIVSAKRAAEIYQDVQLWFWRCDILAWDEASPPEFWRRMRAKGMKWTPDHFMVPMAIEIRPKS